MNENSIPNSHLTEEQHQVAFKILNYEARCLPVIEYLKSSSQEYKHIASSVMLDVHEELLKRHSLLSFLSASVSTERPLNYDLHLQEADMHLYNALLTNHSGVVDYYHKKFKEIQALYDDCDITGTLNNFTDYIKENTTIIDTINHRSKSLRKPPLIPVSLLSEMEMELKTIRVNWNLVAEFLPRFDAAKAKRVRAEEQARKRKKYATVSFILITVGAVLAIILNSLQITDYIPFFGKNGKPANSAQIQQHETEDADKKSSKPRSAKPKITKKVNEHSTT